MTHSSYDTLRWLLDPIAPAEFFAEYWERRPLVLARGRPDHYGDLLRMSEVDRVLTTRQFVHPDLVLTDAAREIRVEDYTFPGNVIDTRRLLKAFSEGGTIILNQLERDVPQLLAFCRALERELSTRLQANVYLTPRSAQGFKPHYDNHDVFILQVHGTKHWFFYDTPIELPMRGQAFEPEETQPGPVSQEITVHPGDLLYIPRGLMHDARTTGEDSLHITAGLLATTWSELLLEAVARAAVADVGLRRSLPVGFARPGFDRAAAAATLRELMTRVLDRLDPDALLDHAADDLIATRLALLEGQLGQLLRLGDLGPDSRVEPRPNLMYQLRETDEHVVLSCFGADLRLPRHAAPALRFALETPAFAVRDLPGELDAQGQLVLVRRLIREGVLRLL